MECRRKKIVSEVLWFFSIFILVIYPLRHIGTGVDLWDGGYNYANFRYSGLEYMDPMWFFATWLANQWGAFLTRLPMGNSVLGMNIYTGLTVSLMAAVSYFFCVKRLRIPAWLVFLGEMAAISICWAPTAVLYSYLTYAFLLIGTILLYQGLTLDKKGYLIAAGAVLGLNVGVRFSNLVQAGLILALWFYGFICRKSLLKTGKETGLCILGYFCAFGGYLVLMSVLYGFSDYWNGILRLFQMTEHASDYTPASMLLGMVWAYYDCTYWLKRFLLIGVGGTAICLLLPSGWKRIKQLLCVAITVAVMLWLMQKGFYSRDYATYNAIYAPCVIVLTMAICLSLFLILSRKTSKEDKLLASFVIITVLITSLGGNNAIYSSINNMFLVLPCFLGMVWKFCRERNAIYYFPVKCMIVLSLFFLGMQSVGFGAAFVYEEATGGREMTCKVQDIPTLQGISTESGKADELMTLYQYLKENELTGKECLLYGQIPGISYYMELPPAINIWSDLRSYSLETMEQDMQRLEEEIKKGGQKPLIILEASCAQYMLDGDPDLFQEETAEKKLQLIMEFMDRYYYKKTFSNNKYVVYE